MKKSLYVLSALFIYGGGLFADTKLDTQVISASGFLDSVSNVSYNLFVLDSKELKERGYKNIKEALVSLPGISTITSGMGQSIDMRGQGEKAKTHVITFIDGVLVNPEDTSHLVAPINTINIDDIEQIEVIPGGGSVVYGNGAVGGVINIITKASLNKDYASVSLKAGSFSHKSANIQVGHKLNDNFYANFGINLLDEKGYQRADINKFFSGNLGLKYFLDNQSFALNLGYMENKLRSSGALSNDEMQFDRRSGGVVFDYLAKSIKNVGDLEASKNVKKDISFKYQNNINENIQLQINPYLSIYEFSDKSFIDTKKGIKIKSKFSYDISTTYLGYEYLHNKGERESIAKNEVIKKSNAIYGIESLSLNDIFNIDFGARYEKAKYDITRNLYTDNASSSAFAFNTIFGVNIDDSNKIYAKIERGYTLAGAYERTDKINGKYVTNDLKPEKYISYELGYKGLIANQFISMAAFYTTTKDEIYINFMKHYPNPEWAYQNISKTKRYGVELALNQSFLDDRLNLFENISYINAKVIDDKLKPYRNGKQIPQVSPFKASIGASYLVLDNLKLRGDYTYYSKTKWAFDEEFGKARGKQVIPLSENDKKAYGLLNLGATYTPIKNFDISLDIKNILGEKYNISCDSSGSCNPAAKQSFYVEFKYSF